jgi:glycosyltransferase involved in cell wall biosynthesis
MNPVNCRTLLGKIRSVPGILIDVMRLFFRRDAGVIPTGIDRVSLEYIRHYGGKARAVLSLGPLAAALSPSDSARMFRWLLDPQPGFRRTAARMALKNAAWDWIWPRIGDSILINTGNLWFNTRYYASQLRWLGARPVFFVHDLIPVRHPEYFRAGEGADFLVHLRNVLRMSRGIVVNSRDTETALMQHAGKSGLRCPPIAVAPLAPRLAAPSAPGLRPVPGPYFVILGTIEPRKNHLLLLDIWRALAKGQCEPPPKLLVIGQRGWEFQSVADVLDRGEALQGVVFERNDCGDAELANLLQHAQALLMPTFAEGFGLPVAEALAAGAPVIASDLPVFRESAGDIPEYADPLDGARWRELILDYARPDSARRRAQLGRIARHRPASWARHFEIVDHFLETLP